MRAQAQMSQWGATGATTARHAMRSAARIGLLAGAVCLQATAMWAQSLPPGVPRLIPQTTTPGAEHPRPQAEPVPGWHTPLVSGQFDAALAEVESAGIRPKLLIVARPTFRDDDAMAAAAARRAAIEDGIVEMASASGHGPTLWVNDDDVDGAAAEAKAAIEAMRA